MKTKIIGFIITIGLWVTACVEPFELGVVSDLRILTVDATLTDIAKEQRITISESFNAKGTAFSSPVLNASVELLINGKETLKFIEKGEGIYALPTNFELKTGTSYQLFFKKTMVAVINLALKNLLWYQKYCRFMMNFVKKEY